MTPAADAFSGENEWEDGASDDEPPLLEKLLRRAPQRIRQNSSQVVDLTVDAEVDEVSS